ncbi:MAG: hypothetical protein HWN66_16270, partial [Candidatus Helarchaeota archaeon]|nr:hypothetical protein [Candidatus Helarchaeota archaeon]
MRRYTRHLLIGILILSFLMTIRFNLPVETELIEPFSENESWLKISNQSINITTPENTTYILPMHGYYFGTEGFEDVDDGFLPDNWYYSGDVGTNASVVASKTDLN